MAACCITIIADRDYLFPSLVSATQARRHAGADKADVIIFGLGLDEPTQRMFASICAAEGLGFIAIDPAVIEGATAIMARLFLDRFVPPQYTQFLYLDGDVQVVRSLDPLIEAAVPPGRFLAANDPFTFELSDGGAGTHRFNDHLRRIGLDPSQDRHYFNSGVLRINRAGWEDIGQRAWATARRLPGASRFADQDLLNLSAADQRMILSLAWNFPIFMRNAGVESIIRPAILHFMSKPKPWFGNFPPWTAKSTAPYRDVLQRYPALAAYHAPVSRRRILRYQLQQHYKQAIESFSWGFGDRRRRILRYEDRIRLAAYV